MKNEIINKSVRALSTLIRNREVSVAEVTEAYLARIAETEHERVYYGNCR